MCHITTRASGLLLEALPNCLCRSQGASFQNPQVHPHPSAPRPGFGRWGERHRQVDGVQDGPSQNRCECLDSPSAVCFFRCLGTALATSTSASLCFLFSGAQWWGDWLDTPVCLTLWKDMLIGCPEVPGLYYRLGLVLPPGLLVELDLISHRNGTNSGYSRLHSQ